MCVKILKKVFNIFINSDCRFRSYDLLVMSQTRFPCAKSLYAHPGARTLDHKLKRLALYQLSQTGTLQTSVNIVCSGTNKYDKTLTSICISQPLLQQSNKSTINQREMTFFSYENTCCFQSQFDLSTGFFQIQVRSGQCELNTRPIDLQSIALPTELYPGGCLQITFIYGALPLSYGRSNNVGIRPDGFDPSTPGL